MTSRNAPRCAFCWRRRVPRGHIACNDCGPGLLRVFARKLAFGSRR